MVKYVRIQVFFFFLWFDVYQSVSWHLANQFRIKNIVNVLFCYLFYHVYSLPNYKIFFNCCSCNLKSYFKCSQSLSLSLPNLIPIFDLTANVGGHCLWGKVPMESLYLSWKMSPNLSLGQRAEIISTVDLHPCFMKVHQ